MNIDESLKKIQILNGTALKIIAALIMVIDHIGYMFFPKVIWIRKVGRLSFPIFAFFVAEGFFYTKDLPLSVNFRLIWLFSGSGTGSIRM